LASPHDMALTAVDNRDLNASGMGIYPLSAKPFWPAPRKRPGSARCDVDRQADYLRQRTPDFDRFHSSLGLLPKYRLVQSCHCGSSKRW
jgi:hypothetical protein